MGEKWPKESGSNYGSMGNARYHAAFPRSNRTFAHYRTNEHYERYMHGGLEGVFGKRPDDTTLAADHAV